ncbi:XerD Site-specific recombinase XerD [Rhabdaerophilaceae bacterium]
MMSADRGAATNTIAGYTRDLEDYLAALASGRWDVIDADLAQIRAYLQNLSEAGLKPATIARRISALRQFHGFLYTEGHRADDPTVTLEGPRRSMSLPKVLTTDDVDRLLNAARHDVKAAKAGSAELAALRMLALVELIYATGLRVSELLSLPAASIAPGRDHLIVRGKGNKERIVLLTQAAKDATFHYRDRLSAKSSASSRYLFPASGETGHLSRQVFARDLKRLAGAAGLRADALSPHVMRHAFATHLLQNGADLRIVQQLLGHVDIATTQIYTHILDERAKAMVRDLHPMADDS